jgi:hypothetical protein
LLRQPHQFQRPLRGRHGSLSGLGQGVRSRVWLPTSLRPSRWWNGSSGRWGGLDLGPPGG